MAVRIRVSYEKPEELEHVLSLLKNGRNGSKSVRISEKKSGKYARAYIEMHPCQGESVSKF